MNDPGSRDERGLRLWSGWLAAVAVALIGFGAALVLLPAPVQTLLGRLLFASGRVPVSGEGMRYVTFVAAVLGATIAGWAAMLLLVAVGPFRRGERTGWEFIAVSVAVWFVPDTGYSLLSGFAVNAALNVVIAIAVAIPLVATRSVFMEADAGARR